MMKSWLSRNKLILTLGISFFYNSACAENAVTELKFEQLYRIQGNFQISGAITMGDAFYFVSDMDHNDKIYYVDLQNGKPDVAYDLQKVDGYKKYAKSFRKKNILKTGFRTNDFEGLAFCDHPLTFFIANERARDILTIKTSDETLKFSSFTVDDQEASTLDFNAGLEGVAADCERKILYVAKEREPRWIYVYHFDQISQEGKIKPKEKFDIPSDPSAIPLDFSDLAFSNDQLFILERGLHRISIYDPKKKTVTQRYSYASIRDHEYDDNHDGKIDEKEKGLFDSKEPYGLAEGLVVQGQTLYIFFDNNKKPLTDYAAKKHSFEKNSDSIVAKFSIPQ